MHKKIKILLLLITLTFFSCKKSEFEILLINSSKKWIYVENPKEHSVQTFYIKFEKNGNSDNYFLSNNQKNIFIDGTHEQGSWKYSEKDNILEIHNYYKFKILKFSKDTIYLYELNNKHKAFLINSVHRKL
jgi:hypothetical protein